MKQDWKAVRKGNQYCAPSCGRGCTWNEYVAAVDKSKCLVTKAVLYLRVSGTTQASEDRDGLPRQEKACEAYAKSHDLEIVGVYTDAGVSGTTELENRPALWQLRNDLLENGVRTVICENLSRLARDLMVSETILADFQRNGIILLSTQEPDLASTEPSRKLIRQILSALCEYDRSMLVSRMKAGKQRVLNSGKRCGGRTPYSEHSSAVELVNRIHFLRRNGYNVSKITEVLNAEGIKSLCGKKFYPAQVSRILRSARKTTEKPQ